MTLDDLILPPKMRRRCRKGYCWVLNSPFDNQDRLQLEKAEDWVRRGRAYFVEGLLVFKTESSDMLQRQVRDSEWNRRCDEGYEKMIDASLSDGRTERESIGRWVIRKSAGFTSQKLIRSWPSGSFPIVEKG